MIIKDEESKPEYIHVDAPILEPLQRVMLEDKGYIIVDSLIDLPKATEKGMFDEGWKRSEPFKLYAADVPALPDYLYAKPRKTNKGLQMGSYKYKSNKKH